MKPNFATVTALIACCILSVLLSRARREAANAYAEAAALRSATNSLAGELTRAQERSPTESEKARLEKDLAEALKLRAEVAKLKQEVEDARAIAAAATNAANAQPDLNPNQDPGDSPYVRKFARKFTADLAAGHAVVFGGWQTSPGKQTFALAVPTTSSDSPNQVLVQTKVFELSDDALSKFDASLLVRAAGHQAMITPEELTAFTNSIQQTAGAKVLSSPRALVFSGQKATVSVSQAKTMPDGTVVKVGPSMEMVPTLGADQTTVNLAVDAKLTVPAEDVSPKP